MPTAGGFGVGGPWATGLCVCRLRLLCLRYVGMVHIPFYFFGLELTRIATRNDRVLCHNEAPSHPKKELPPGVLMPVYLCYHLRTS